MRYSLSVPCALFLISVVTADVAAASSSPEPGNDYRCMIELDSARQPQARLRCEHGVDESEIEGSAEHPQATRNAEPIPVPWDSPRT